MNAYQSLRSGLSQVTLLLLATSTTAAGAGDPPSVNFAPWQPLFQGIDMTRGECQLSSGQWQQGVALRIDLGEPSLHPFLTADNGDSPLETNGETTSNFLKRNKLSVAINVHFFSPCCAPVDGQSKDLISLAVSNGEVVSPWEERMPDVMLMNHDMSVRITDEAPNDLDEVWLGLAGRRILREGKVAVANRTSTFATTRHPRSALGLSGDGAQLILLVIDGRQSEHSVGATLVETAQWLAALGAAGGLNVDGGGSTTLVAAKPDGTALILNQVSGGVERVVGSNLGFRAPPLNCTSTAD